MALESCAREDSQSELDVPHPSVLEVDGQLDGRYRLRRLLAQSAGAFVYAAEHTFTQRAVAVKLPRAGSIDAGTYDRFRAEVDALARVRGTGVVELLDAGRLGERPYIVLELLEGRTVAGLITARGRLALADAAKIGLQVADALERCHQSGVVHRDIKPGNLFVTRGGTVKLLDFGIATLDGADSEHGDACAVRGTPEYMAPEALLSLPADHRADIYGFGVTLYECLTGAVPHEGDHAEVLRKVSSASGQALAEALREVPVAFRELLSRCLARAPEDRFQSAAELRGALEPRQLDAELTASATISVEHQRQQPDTIADGPAAKLNQRHTSRRKHPRAPYTTLARITQQTGAVMDGRLEEVSEGGLQFIGDRALATGEMVKIRFALPATGRVTEVSAAARWSRGARSSHATGFEFLEIADGARAELRNYARIMCPSMPPS
jgi:eukaryotic-like serine/threonine-protein kinase